MTAAMGARALRQWLPLAPALAFLALFFVYPLARMVALSMEAKEGPFAYYASILTSPVYMTVLGLTFKTALGVTLLCVVLGVPTAYLLASLQARGATRCSWRWHCRSSPRS